MGPTKFDNEILQDAAIHDDTLSINLWYPTVEGMLKKIEVGLMAVRAADSILIEYDFDRDGYSIKQASKFSWEADDIFCDPDWQEVSFIQAWARKETDLWDKE